LPKLRYSSPWLASSTGERSSTLAGVIDERTKFHHIISQVYHQYAAEMEDITTSPPKNNPSTTLQTRLVDRLSSSKEQGSHQLLALETGDRKPAQFLRHLRSLALDVPDYFICLSSSAGYHPKYRPFSPASLRLS
jgi:hypothetical protein